MKSRVAPENPWAHDSYKRAHALARILRGKGIVKGAKYAMALADKKVDHGG